MLRCVSCVGLSCSAPPPLLLPLLSGSALRPVVFCSVLLCAWCCNALCSCACIVLFSAGLVCVVSVASCYGALLWAVLFPLAFCVAVVLPCCVVRCVVVPCCPMLCPAVLCYLVVLCCRALLVPCVVAYCFWVFVAGSGCSLLSFGGVFCRWCPCLSVWPAALLCAVVCPGALHPCAVSCSAVFPCGAVLWYCLFCFAGGVCLFHFPLKTSAIPVKLVFHFSK